MAGISTSTPYQNAPFNLSQIRATIGGKEMFLAHWQARP
jgi:hypothetical protein